MSIEELRKRYAVVPPVVLCAGCHAMKGKELYCRECGDMWTKTLPAQGDPAVLALCDEVEALRAKVPEVLREWPAKAEDAPGGWAYFVGGGAIVRGGFGATACGDVVFLDSHGHFWTQATLDARSFFVRVPA